MDTDSEENVMENIYDDICDFDLGSELEKLKEENKLLGEHIKSLELDIQKLVSSVNQLKENQDNLTKNISALFSTAKAEIERKDRMIQELRTEIENMRFRRDRKDPPFKRKDRENSSSEINFSAKKFKYDDTLNNNRKIEDKDLNKYNSTNVTEKHRRSNRSRSRDRDEKYSRERNYLDRSKRYPFLKADDRCRNRRRSFDGKNSRGYSDVADSRKERLRDTDLWENTGIKPRSTDSSDESKTRDSRSRKSTRERRGSSDSIADRNRNVKNGIKTIDLTETEGNKTLKSSNQKSIKGGGSSDCVDGRSSGGKNKTEVIDLTEKEKIDAKSERDSISISSHSGTPSETSSVSEVDDFSKPRKKLKVLDKMEKMMKEKQKSAYKRASNKVETISVKDIKTEESAKVHKTNQLVTGILKTKIDNTKLSECDAKTDISSSNLLETVEKKEKSNNKYSTSHHKTLSTNDIIKVPCISNEDHKDDKLSSIKDKTQLTENDLKNSTDELKCSISRDIADIMQVVTKRSNKDAQDPQLPMNNIQKNCKNSLDTAVEADSLDNKAENQPIKSPSDLVGKDKRISQENVFCQNNSAKLLQTGDEPEVAININNDNIPSSQQEQITIISVNEDVPINKDIEIVINADHNTIKGHGDITEHIKNPEDIEKLIKTVGSRAKKGCDNLIEENKASCVRKENVSNNFAQLEHSSKDNTVSQQSVKNSSSKKERENDNYEDICKEKNKFIGDECQEIINMTEGGFSQEKKALLHTIENFKNCENTVTTNTKGNANNELDSTNNFTKCNTDRKVNISDNIKCKNSKQTANKNKDSMTSPTVDSQVGANTLTKEEGVDSGSEKVMESKQPKREGSMNRNQNKIDMKDKLLKNKNDHVENGKSSKRKRKDSSELLQTHLGKDKKLQNQGTQKEHTKEKNKSFERINDTMETVTSEYKNTDHTDLNVLKTDKKNKDTEVKMNVDVQNEMENLQPQTLVAELSSEKCNKDNNNLDKKQVTHLGDDISPQISSANKYKIPKKKNLSNDTKESKYEGYSSVLSFFDSEVDANKKVYNEKRSPAIVQSKSKTKNLEKSAEKNMKNLSNKVKIDQKFSENDLKSCESFKTEMGGVKKVDAICSDKLQKVSDDADRVSHKVMKYKDMRNLLNQSIILEHPVTNEVAVGTADINIELLNKNSKACQTKQIVNSVNMPDIKTHNPTDNISKNNFKKEEQHKPKESTVVHQKSNNITNPVSIETIVDKDLPIEKIPQQRNNNCTNTELGDNHETGSGSIVISGEKLQQKEKVLKKALKGNSYGSSQKIHSENAKQPIEQGSKKMKSRRNTIEKDTCGSKTTKLGEDRDIVQNQLILHETSNENAIIIQEILQAKKGEINILEKDLIGTNINQKHFTPKELDKVDFKDVPFERRPHRLKGRSKKKKNQATESDNAKSVNENENVEAALNLNKTSCKDAMNSSESCEENKEQSKNSLERVTCVSTSKQNDLENVKDMPVKQISYRRETVSNKTNKKEVRDCDGLKLDKESDNIAISNSQLKESVNETPVINTEALQKNNDMLLKETDLEIDNVLPLDERCNRRKGKNKNEVDNGKVVLTEKEIDTRDTRSPAHAERELEKSDSRTDSFSDIGIDKRSESLMRKGVANSDQARDVLMEKKVEKSGNTRKALLENEVNQPDNTGMVLKRSAKNTIISNDATKSLTKDDNSNSTIVNNDKIYSSQNTEKIVFPTNTQERLTDKNPLSVSKNRLSGCGNNTINIISNTVIVPSMDSTKNFMTNDKGIAENLQAAGFGAKIEADTLTAKHISKQNVEIMPNKKTDPCTEIKSLSVPKLKNEESKTIPADRQQVRKRITPTPVVDDKPMCTFKNILNNQSPSYLDSLPASMPPLHLTHEGEIPVLHLEDNQINNLPSEKINDRNIMSLLDTMNISNIDCDMPKFKSSSCEAEGNSEIIPSDNNLNVSATEGNSLSFKNFISKATSSTPMTSTKHSGSSEPSIAQGTNFNHGQLCPSINSTSGPEAVKAGQSLTTSVVRRGRRRCRMVIRD